MTRPRAWVCFAAASGALGGTAIAQESGDKARLDDFALPSSEQPLRVEQVTRGTAAVVPSLPAGQRDRTLARPSRSDPAGTMPRQLSAPNQSGEVAQLATVSQSRTALAAVASNPKDRLPGGVQRIGGEDRCDPAQEKSAYAECLRILELRADEFHAPEAPTLSPEQRLLGEMRQTDEHLTGANGTLRMRAVTGGRADADLQSNQELAAIVLASQQPSTQPTAEQTEADKTAALAEVLQALGVPVVTSPSPNP